MKHLLGKAVRFVGAKSPVILLAIGIGSVVAGSVALVKASVEADKKIKEFEQEVSENTMDGEEPDPLTFKEKARATWKIFLKPVVLIGLGLLCFIGSHSISMSRQAMLASTATILESRIGDLEAKVIDTLGEDEGKKLINSIPKDKMSSHTAEEINANTIATGNGTTLFYDKHSDRYFTSSTKAIDKADLKIKSRIISWDECSLNEVYDLLDIPRISCDLGDNFIVDYRDVNIYGDDQLIDIGSSKIAPNGEPCIIVSIPVRFRYKGC